LSSAAEIRRRIEQNWVRFVNENSVKLALDSIDGSSPPSLFVGRYGYPKVKIGPMIPPIHGDTTILDKTELWPGKSIEEIVNYRLSLVRGKLSMDVNENSGRFLENIQELAMSERPAESEATFEKRPTPDIELEKEIHLDTEVAPFGLSAPIKAFRLSSISADQRIEDVYYDFGLRASDAVIELYKRGVQTSSIQKVFSVGMLGLKNSRKLVPTRWSISATDDIISRNLIIGNEISPSVDLFEVMHYSHLANYYTVVLIPNSEWSFEMIEWWFSGSGQIAIGLDHEDARGLDHYPTIAGAYFAARLAVAEHLVHRRRKAAVLVLREIHPEYVIPLGVWQIREGVREALKKPPQKFESFDDAIAFASGRMSLSKEEILQKSHVWQELRNQTRMTDFA